MSTRSTIYYQCNENDGEPDIHIYTEMMDGSIRLEIELPYCVVNIPLPVDLQSRLGIPQPAKENP